MIYCNPKCNVQVVEDTSAYRTGGTFEVFFIVAFFVGTRRHKGATPRPILSAKFNSAKNLHSRIIMYTCI